MPDPAAFWDKIARRYAAKPVRDPAAYELTLERVRAHLSPADTAMELGCGTGSTAIALAPEVGHLTATDVSPEMIAIADEKAANAGHTNLDFRVADAVAALESVRERPLDVVLAFHLLHLVPDLPGTLAAIAAALRPGGLLISKTVCLGDGPGWIKLVLPVMRLFGKAPQVALLEASALEAAIKTAGFEIAETGTFPASPPSRFIVARQL